MNALTKGGALVEGKLDDTVEMEAEYLEDAKSAYEYLRWSSGRKSAFYETFAESKIAKSFYDNGENGKNIKSYYYRYELNGEEIDVGEYNSIQMISEKGTERLQDLDLTAFLLSLDSLDDGRSFQAPLTYELADGRKIVFECISYDYDQDEREFAYLYYNGILFSGRQ